MEHRGESWDIGIASIEGTEPCENGLFQGEGISSHAKTAEHQREKWDESERKKEREAEACREERKKRVRD